MREPEAVQVLKDAVKPSTAIRTVQKMTEKPTFENISEELLRQMNDLRAETAQVDELETENQRIRQSK